MTVIIVFIFALKCKVHSRTCHEGPEGEIYSSALPSASALDGSGWPTLRSDPFIPGKDPLLIV